ncbi:unnamed protein product [marine sediment metagenome]|uniref:Uncharacterized protein n=1 Tax=marine sediment metagenome TaxID=412755 RepID=X1N8D6_9ZZZZ
MLFFEVLQYHNSKESDLKKTVKVLEGLLDESGEGDVDTPF